MKRSKQIWRIIWGHNQQYLLVYQYSKKKKEQITLLLLEETTRWISTLFAKVAKKDRGLNKRFMMEKPRIPAP